MENISEHIFNNLGELALFVKENESNSKIFQLRRFKEQHENTFGGCSCNRQRRMIQARDFYVENIKKLESHTILAMKEILKVERIKFKCLEKTQAEIIAEY
jgi:hypothetical protein